MSDSNQLKNEQVQSLLILLIFINLQLKATNVQLFVLAFGCYLGVMSRNNTQNQT